MGIINPLLERTVGRAVNRWATNPTGLTIPKHARDLTDAHRSLPGFGQDPIFHVCGLTSSGWMYGAGINKLKQHGFNARAMRMPFHGWDGIPSDSKKLRAEIVQYLADLRSRGYDVSRVQLSGDSEGGLIALHALENDPALRPLVSKLVTNGTPHQGIRVGASDKLTKAIQKFWLTPPGVRDLLITSPVTAKIKSGWEEALRAMVELDPNFRAHSVASRTFGTDHDSLVPVHSAWLHGDRAYVTNYLTEGGHSLNLAFGRHDSTNFRTLMAAYGSSDPAHHAAAAQAHATSQAWAATRQRVQ